jgi:hypothetical protein
VGIRENIHCSGQRVYENTKIKLSLGAKAIIIVHYNGHWTSGGYTFHFGYDVLLIVGNIYNVITKI